MNLKTRSSLDLMNNIKDSSDQEAKHELYQRYSPLVSIVVRRLGFPEAEAEIVAKETMDEFIKRCLDNVSNSQTHHPLDILLNVTINKIGRLPQHHFDVGAHVEHKVETTDIIDRLKEKHIKALWNEEHKKAIMRQCLQEVRQKVNPMLFEAFQLYVLHQWPLERVISHLQIDKDTISQSKENILSRIREIMPTMIEAW